MSHSLRERFDASYVERAVAFADAVRHLDVCGIPEPHLPHWGRLYEASPLRVGVIGRDTRSWGKMENFLENVRINPLTAIHRGEEEFDSFEFTKWTNNFGKTFWDTAMKLLASVHGIPDWKRLKRREDEVVLKSFFWANVNSVERYEVSPRDNCVPWEIWRKVKDASEAHLDSFTEILHVFRPHVVFLMNWDPGSHFQDLPLTWDHFGDHQASSFYETTQTHVLVTGHPTWLNRNGLYEEAINGLAQKAAELVTRAPSTYQGLSALGGA